MPAQLREGQVSIEARDRAVLRRGAVAEVEEDLVDIAPAPAFPADRSLDVGCVAWKCLVAWRLGELSQQPTWPQVRQSRRCTHCEPIFRHSSQPSALGVTSRMSAAWSAFVRHQSLPTELQAATAVAAVLREIGVQRRHHLGAFADRRRDALDRAGAHVADGEDAAAAGLQRMRRSQVRLRCGRSPWRPAPRRIAPASRCSGRRR